MAAGVRAALDPARRPARANAPPRRASRAGRAHGWCRCRRPPPLPGCCGCTPGGRPTARRWGSRLARRAGGPATRAGAAGRPVRLLWPARCGAAGRRVGRGRDRATGGGARLALAASWAAPPAAGHRMSRRESAGCLHLRARLLGQTQLLGLSLDELLPVELPELLARDGDDHHLARHARLRLAAARGGRLVCSCTQRGAPPRSRAARVPRHS